MIDSNARYFASIDRLSRPESIYETSGARENEIELDPDVPVFDFALNVQSRIIRATLMFAFWAGIGAAILALLYNAMIRKR